MAKVQSTVYLGYEDELIVDKYKSLVNYTTNKVGGSPNWPISDVSIPACPICGLNRPLIIQIYAPLDNSQFHRTLYIFACLNPSCSNQSHAWICVRSQALEKIIECEQPVHHHIHVPPPTSWCSGADDWDDGSPQSDDVQNSNEKNGNVLMINQKMDNRMSDEDEESNSYENDVLPNAFGNLHVVDDKNANCDAQGGGAVGRMHSPSASAEIEGEESELVTIDTPLAPQRDLIALFKQQALALPSGIANCTLKSFFISVDVERRQANNAGGGIMNDHVRELWEEYKLKDEAVRISPDSPGTIVAAVGDGESENESYEKGVPMHGDMMFHNFLVTIQENPGQILRYSRDSLPLTIAPITEPILKCQNCGGDVICEVQVLPTLIPILRLENGEAAPIDFGNILIYTCNKSCWDTPDRMRLEHVLVQQEK